MSKLILGGLGISKGDISLKLLAIAKRCNKIYFELYTGKIPGVTKEYLEQLFNKKIKELKRQDLEERSNDIINEAKNKNILVLVPGDPLVFTTHTSLLLEAKENNVKTEIIHAPSIYSAIGEVGLFLYKFGRTVTLTKPIQKTTLQAIKQNQKSGLHTLVLLDIGMTPSRALKLLSGKIPGRILAASQLGGNPEIRYGKIPDLLKLKLNKTPAVLAIPGKLHFLEKEYLETL